MSDWREKLKHAKRQLGEASPAAGHDEKAAGIGFQPPQSWLDKDKAQTKSTNAEPAACSAAPQPDRKPRVILRACKSLEDTRAPFDVATASPGTAPIAAANTSPPCFRPRLEPGRVMRLPDWAILGKSLQHPAGRDSQGRPLPVRIGLDFGTAFTKVAVRAGPDVFVVDWTDVTGDDSPMGRHVVPGIVVRRWDGEYSWTGRGRFDVRSNLKLPLFQEPVVEDCPVDTIAYLALVIRCARASLYRHAELGRRLAGRKLLWDLNIGCPTRPSDNKKVLALFQRVAQVAWRLAGSDRLHETDILSAWESGGDALDGLEASPGVVPEFVAQIAGYLKSPRVGEGLHALVDVGAATLDVATFNVVNAHGDEPPRIPIFFSTVQPLGTHYLNHARHSGLHLNLEWDDAASVEHAAAFAKRHGKLPGDVREVDADFVKRVVKCVVNVIATTRINNRGLGGRPDRNGCYSEGTVWFGGLPTFITGGGAACDLYREAMKQIESEIKRNLGSYTKFRLIKLQPTGLSLTFSVEDVAGRTTVALGLTEDAENIARIVPHSEIDAITHSPPPTRIDHEELYPR